MALDSASRFGAATMKAKLQDPLNMLLCITIDIDKVFLSVIDT